MIARMTTVLLSVLCLNAALPAFAGTPDPRIVERPYSPNDVYRISIRPMLASVVEFATDEAVDSIVVGDASHWLVETTGSANRIVVKPVNGASSTNMIVVTTKRTYSFVLDAYGGPDVFVFRFQHAVRGETAQNSTYRLRGDRKLYPRLISDNGRFTSIYWPEDVRFPAVLIVDDDGEEVAAISRAAGNGLIIDGVHDRFVFRAGKDKATARRKAGDGRDGG